MTTLKNEIIKKWNELHKNKKFYDDIKECDIIKCDIRTLKNNNILNNKYKLIGNITSSKNENIKEGDSINEFIFVNVEDPNDIIIL